MWSAFFAFFSKNVVTLCPDFDKGQVLPLDMIDERASRCLLEREGLQEIRQSKADLQVGVPFIVARLSAAYTPFAETNARINSAERSDFSGRETRSISIPPELVVMCDETAGREYPQCAVGSIQSARRHDAAK
jgi:hypothetical protein